MAARRARGAPGRRLRDRLRHHPRFSSGFGGANQPHPETGPLFADLYQHGVDSLRQSLAQLRAPRARHARGNPRPQGASRSSWSAPEAATYTSTPAPQLTVSEVLRTDVFGVLELTLEPGAYSARFVGEDGLTVDQAAAPATRPPAGA